MAHFMKTETEIPTYFMFPRFLLEADLPETAKLTYLVLLDRARLSQTREDWTDEKGRVFVVFPIEELAGVLRKSQCTVQRSLSVLGQAGLIHRVHRGVGRPDRIYVKVPHRDESPAQADSSPRDNACPSAGHQPSSGRSESDALRVWKMPGHGAQKPSPGLSETDVTWGSETPCHGGRNPSPRVSETHLSGLSEMRSLGEQKPSGNKNYRERTTKQERQSKSARAGFGAYGNVFLSDSEYADLQHTVSDCAGYIEQLSSYMAATGKRYQNCHAAIRSWAARDNKLILPSRYDYSPDESL